MTLRLSFGRCELRPQERQLLIDGQPVPLGARAFDVLLALVERRDRVVGKSELLDLAWPGLMVEENNLSVQISALRKVLGSQAIATIPALGYRFAMSSDAPQPDRAGPAAARLPTTPPPEPTSPAQALRQQPALLCGRLSEPDAAAWRACGLRWAQALPGLVADHGGWLLPTPAGECRAEFGSARGAAACSHRLHDLVRSLGQGLPQDHQPGLQMALVPGGAGAVEAVELGARLVALAGPGQTLVSVQLAGALVHTLDGDVCDLGEQHADHASPPLRLFRLGPATDDVEGVLTRPVDNLRPTVAVIPFSAYARQPEAVVLGDIVADQVIGTLSRSHAINVISRLSTLAFRDRDTAVPQIARRLAADFVVSGRYWVDAGRVSVHVEVAEAATGRVLWTQTVADDERAALYPDSTLVLELVAGIVQAVYAHEVASLRAAALPDLASHTLLLAAINLLYRLSPREFSLAHDALHTLHQRAPRHPAPLAWLARWHLFRIVQGWSDDRDADGRLALDHANHALDLDPDSSLALTMLGNVHTNFLRDLARADTLYDQALALNPNESIAWLQKGNARSFRGDGAGALAHAEKAVSLSPLDPSRHFYLSILASAALTAQQYGRAIEAARSSLRLNHEHVSTHRVLAIALAMSGCLDEARDSVGQVLRLEPRLTVADYVARSPGAQSGLAQTFGAALQAAGLPAGPGE